jgi:Class II Aldolase and Adducin N-terminal domain
MTVTAIPGSHMTQAEAQIRIGLAACYRLVDLFGWSDLINTRITARVPGAQNHFLINRFGMLYDEITASSLVSRLMLMGTRSSRRITRSIAAASRSAARSIWRALMSTA